MAKMIAHACVLFLCSNCFSSPPQQPKRSQTEPSQTYVSWTITRKLHHHLDPILSCSNTAQVHLRFSAWWSQQGAECLPRRHPNPQSHLNNNRSVHFKSAAFPRCTSFRPSPLDTLQRHMPGRALQSHLSLTPVNTSLPSSPPLNSQQTPEPPSKKEKKKKKTILLTTHTRQGHTTRLLPKVLRTISKSQTSPRLHP